MQMKNAYKILVGKPEGNRPPRRPRLTWEDSTRIDITDIVLEVDWIHLGQDTDWWQAYVNMVMNLLLP
jgi:hypothetical protein